MPLQGAVYLRIMDDVIENCQTTFEEDGVSHQTLDDLKSVGTYHFCRSHCYTSNLLCLSFAYNDLIQIVKRTAWCGAKHRFRSVALL